jgi:hypothetical protein
MHNKVYKFIKQKTVYYMENQSNSDLGAVMRSALSWWNKLSKSQQRTCEMQMFGYGEWWEDNSLCNADILKMYQHYA